MFLLESQLSSLPQLSSRKLPLEMQVDEEPSTPRVVGSITSNEALPVKGIVGRSIEAKPWLPGLRMNQSGRFGAGIHLETLAEKSGF